MTHNNFYLSSVWRIDIEDRGVKPAISSKKAASVAMGAPMYHGEPPDVEVTSIYMLSKLFPSKGDIKHLVQQHGYDMDSVVNVERETGIYVPDWIYLDNVKKGDPK